MTKDLRALTVAAMKGIPGDPPSMNQIRRRLGAWFPGTIARRAWSDRAAGRRPRCRAQNRFGGGETALFRVPEQAIAIVRDLAERAAKQAPEPEAAPAPAETSLASA